MKGRIGSYILRWTAIHAAALIAVLLLAYGAGARSGGLGLRDFGALPQAAGLQLVAALFVIATASFALMLQLTRRILKPVEQLTYFFERTEERDYTARVELGSEDDFGIIAEGCNRMVTLAERADTSEAQQQALHRSLSELTEVVHEVGRGELFSRAHVMADSSAALAEALNRALENLGRMLEQVHVCASELAQDTRQGLSAAETVAGSATRQQQEIAGVMESLERLATALRDTSAGAETGVHANQQALEAANQSGQLLREAAEGAERIRAAMAVAAERIKSLSERSLRVYEVINIINDSHLLAVNAAIESSRAAQAGKGLDVLDAELRKLADHSRKSTKNIVELLQSIHAEANEAAAVVEQASRLAEADFHDMEQAVSAFSKSSELLEEAAVRAEFAGEACRARLEETQNLTASLQNSARVARLGSDAANKAVAAMEQLVRAAIQLHETLSRLRITPPLKAEALAAELVAAAGSGSFPALP